MGPGGKGGNQAVAAARLGAHVTMVTKVGHDVFGDEALANFTNENIVTTHVTRHPDEVTGTALIAVDNQSENMIVVAPGACGKITKEDVYKAKQSFQEADIVLLQLETAMETVETTINLAHELGKQIVLNPAPYQDIGKDLLEKVNYITPNEIEAEFLTGVKVADKESALKAAKSLKNQGIEVVIITLGKAGCFVYDGSDEGYMVPAFTVDVVDTTGAGDAFNGAFTTFIAEGYELKEAATRANAVAALAVTKLGTARAMPFPEEVAAFLKD